MLNKSKHIPAQILKFCRANLKWVIGVGVGILALGIFLMITPRLWMESKSSQFIHTNVATVPHKHVGIVLGAGVWPNGEPTPLLKARLSGAIELYQAEKIDAILVSGDNGEKNYNEPDNMRKYLINNGVPADKVTLDYAGFSTYDTCYRAKDVFGQTEAIILTQSYHLSRAVYTCRQLEVAVEGYVTDGIYATYADLIPRYKAREFLSSLKAMLELKLTHPKPKFLGPNIPL